ncbi:type II secretion system F family protein, partial [Thermodesulfitimonas autotrophica]|uniref:type II secretion system F family protein n=1 Tax=Thermodesulfitimonas autotrophica TaxID=1894989 RepID=UPI002FDF53F3
ENKVLRSALEGVVERLEGGLSLTEAFRLYPRVFPAVFTSMVEAGEVSGTLEEVLERLAVHFEKEHEIREAVRGALTYPVIVLIVAALVIGILLTFVVPTFVNIFRDMNLPLPLPTRFLMELSLFCKRFWPLLLFGLLLTGVALRYFFVYTPQGREVWDRFVLRVPVLGALVRKVIVARFARTLGTMVQSGVPILAALEVVKRTIGNVVITRALEQTIENVSEGGAIAGLLEKTGVFPPMVTRMVAVGEETGALEELLEKVAVFYDQDVEATAKRLSVAIEPLLIVVLGFIVGSIILSVLVPIFSIYGSVR